MSIKHLRISCEHKNTNHVLQSFVAKFKPIKWFAAYENKNKLGMTYREYNRNDHSKCDLDLNRDEPYEINPHIQALITYETVPTKQAISEFFKKMPILKNKDEGNNIAGYYHKEITKSEEDNLMYILKDGHIISYEGYSENEIDELYKKTKVINENKKLSSKEKLYNIYCEKIGIKYPDSKFELFKFIDEVYVIDWNKTPLAIGHKTCYSIYILMMIHKNIEVKEDKIYECLLLNIYSIRDHRELLHDINKERVIELHKRDEIAYNNCDFIDDCL